MWIIDKPVYLYVIIWTETVRRSCFVLFSFVSFNQRNVQMKPNIVLPWRLLILPLEWSLHTALSIINNIIQGDTKKCIPQKLWKAIKYCILPLVVTKLYHSKAKFLIYKYVNFQVCTTITFVLAGEKFKVLWLFSSGQKCRDL